MSAVLKIVREGAALTFIFLKIDAGGGRNCAKVEVDDRFLLEIDRLQP